MAVMRSDGDRRITCGEWIASRPFRRLPSEAEAERLALAWNTALRIGRESTPPVPGPRYEELMAEYSVLGPVGWSER